MKKIYMIALAATMIATTASARKIVLTVTLNSPANNSVLTVGTPFSQDFVLKNMGPDAILPTDTLFYIDPTNSQGQAWIRVGLSKAVNDTIHIVKSLNPTSPTSGQVNYCIYSYVSNAANNLIVDSAYSQCNKVTINGNGGTAVNEIRVNEIIADQTMSIFPNPANGVIHFDFVAQNDAEVTARVFDLSGRTVLTRNYGKAYKGKKDFTLDISNLTNGMYLVELRQNELRAKGKLNKL